jgi:hypothetical protein
VILIRREKVFGKKIKKCVCVLCSVFYMCVLIVSEGVIKEVIVCVYRGDHVCVCKLFNIYIYIYI